MNFSSREDCLIMRGCWGQKTPELLYTEADRDRRMSITSLECLWIAFCSFISGSQLQAHFFS